MPAGDGLVRAIKSTKVCVGALRATRSDDDARAKVVVPFIQPCTLSSALQLAGIVTFVVAFCLGA